MTVLPSVQFAFQPLLSTRTGEPVAVEALPRPEDGTVYDLLRHAARMGRLTETDMALAVDAITACADPLPLHVNILAATAARAEEFLRLLRPALSRTGRQADTVVLEITPPFSRVRRGALVRGLDVLRGHGFGLAFDSVGDGDLPISLLTDVRPDLVKVDARLVAGLPDDDACLAAVELLAQYCARVEARLAAVGVDDEDMLLRLHRAGVRLVQGDLRLPGGVAPTQFAEPAARVPMVADFLRPAPTLPQDAPADAARELFADNPTITAIVLVDPRGRPVSAVSRSRFLLAVTGLYGHALNANRPAARHGEPPRTTPVDATGLQLLEAVDDGDWDRSGGDVVAVDATGVCQGVVRLGEVVRAVAAARIEQAAALNPLTRLPGSGALDRDVDRRIHRGELFVAAWLDVDNFKSVNDTAGFAAGDDLIRTIGRELSRAQTDLPGIRVGHVGGDDFLVVAGAEEISTVAGRVVDRPWSAEGIPVSLSFATLVCAPGSVTSYRDVSRLLAPVKRHAKSVPGPSWVLAHAGSDHVEVLHGRPPLSPTRVAG
ncbi:GGDEF domain-containing protein [Actinokineospora guangxiensis]|uniref:GGDEF domain-containing protein n=1 Tax=Actinokineospora guangxiensis TaxID=1490288 RepID=A0ABW0EKT4_9PSEU